MTNPTPASEWKRIQREGSAIITLPSGRSVRMRPTRLDVMLKKGKIPNVLIPLVSKLLWEGLEEPLKHTDSLQEYLELVDLICMASVVEPELVDRDEDIDENSVHVDDLDLMTEKVWIFTIAIQPAELLFRLHERQITSVDDLSDGNSIQREAVGPIRD